MAFLDDVRTRIVGIPVTGYDVDCGYMSDDSDQRVTLYEYTGIRPDHGFGFPGLQFEYPGLQVVVRGAATDYAGPRAIIQAIFLDLPKLQATTVGGTVFKFVRPQQSPFFLKRDEKQRVWFAANFIVWKNA